jgi:response regulator RpfG family c-di-GMP phosphodiesterase
MINRADGKRPMERHEAIAELKSNAGKKYEPAVVSAFIEMMGNSDAKG